MSCMSGEEYITVLFVAGLTRTAALKIFDDLPERIIAVEGGRLVQRNPKRLGNRARYRADEYAVALGVQEEPSRGAIVKHEIEFCRKSTSAKFELSRSRLTLLSGACIARGSSP